MERFDGIRAVHHHALDPGLVWTKDPEPCIGPDSPLDSLSILTPNVVRLPAGGYRLYYTGWGPGRAVPDANRLHPERRVRRRRGVAQGARRPPGRA